MMKNQMLSLLLLGMLFVNVGVFAQTGQDSRELSPFNGVKISQAIEAELVKGNRNHIEITASGINTADVETKVQNRKLEVKLAKGNLGSNSVKVVITYTDLDRVEASSSAKVFVKDMIESKEVFISALTSSYVETKVNASKLTLETSTNGKIFIEGKARDLDLKAFTKGEINGDKLEVDRAEVKTNTAAESLITVKESIKGTAATAAKVLYNGDPAMVDVKTNTGGDIRKK